MSDETQTGTALRLTIIFAGIGVLGCLMFDMFTALVLFCGFFLGWSARSLDEDDGQ